MLPGQSIGQPWNQQKHESDQVWGHPCSIVDFVVEAVVDRIWRMVPHTSQYSVTAGKASEVRIQAGVMPEQIPTACFASG